MVLNMISLSNYLSGSWRRERIWLGKVSVVAVIMEEQKHYLQSVLKQNKAAN